MSYGLKRWRRVQYVAEEFWKKWQTSYLTRLQARAKWLYHTRAFRQGDIVLIREKTPRNLWPMGKIEEVLPGRDGAVRRAKVRVRPSAAGAKRLLERAAHDLVLLVASDS